MVKLKRISNIIKYGLGPDARRKKEADKAKLRHAKFWEGERWERDGGLARRDYGSYDEYLSHQASKLDGVIDRLRETEEEDYTEFLRRFESCEPLSEARSVLCLGARIGTEVKALHALGHFAVGIDLNPGQHNPYVLPGDFQRIVFPDESVDAIYTNALDHAFDLEGIVGEVSRLLRPNGLFVADVLLGYEEGFIAGEFEATHWANSQSFIEKIRDVGDFELENVRELGQHRRDHWRQAVFRKSA